MSTNFPDIAADPLLDRLSEQYAGLRARTAELAAALERVPSKIDEETIDRAAGFVKQVKTCAKEAEAARKAEKDDYLQAGRKVDGFFAGLLDALKRTADEVERRMQAYLKAKADEERRRREEEARIAREAAAKAAAEARRIREAEEAASRAEEETARKAEAERIAALSTEADLDAAIAAEEAASALAQQQEEDRLRREQAAAEAERRAREEVEAAERAASAKAADLARTRGTLGGTATLATSIGFEITDRAAAVTTLAACFDDAAIDKAARAFMRANSDPLKARIREGGGEHKVPGIRFFNEFRARVA